MFGTELISTAQEAFLTLCSLSHFCAETSRELMPRIDHLFPFYIPDLGHRSRFGVSSVIAAATFGPGLARLTLLAYPIGGTLA